MTTPTPTATGPDWPPVERVTIPLCAHCLDGTGGECHTPGCALWMSTAPDVVIRDMTEPAAAVTEVAGHCPMGCGQTLRHRPNTGRIACIAADCPRPLAVTDLLADAETEHLLTVTDTGWTAKHPLRERLDDALLTCRAADVPRHYRLPAPTSDGPTVYRLVLDDGVSFLAPLNPDTGSAEADAIEEPPSLSGGDDRG